MLGKQLLKEKSMVITIVTISIILLLIQGYNLNKIDNDFMKQTNNTFTIEQKQAIKEYVQERAETTMALLLPIILIFFVFTIDFTEFAMKKAVLQAKIEVLKTLLETIDTGKEEGKEENDEENTTHTT